MADLTPHAAQAAADGSLLSNAVSYLGLGGAGAVVLWRALVFFGRQDRAAKMEAELRDELRERAAKLEATLDRIAHERNEAVQVRLQLETKLSMTEERLTSARAERDDARAAVVRLQHDVEQLTAANHRLTEEATIADARAEVRCAPPSPPMAADRPGSRAIPGERPWKA